MSRAAAGPGTSTGDTGCGAMVGSVGVVGAGEGTGGAVFVMGPFTAAPPGIATPEPDAPTEPDELPPKAPGAPDEYDTSTPSSLTANVRVPEGCCTSHPAEARTGVP